MILIISLVKEKLYQKEFIDPIKKLINEKVEIKHYLENINFDKYDKIIISGTSLKDLEYIENIEKFSWITEYNKPLLGICAGAQIIARIFNADLIDHEEIGIINPEIKKEDKIIENLYNRSYALHRKAFTLPKDFEIILETNTPQLIRKNNIYACLFHPEVKNKEIILNFINL